MRLWRGAGSPVRRKVASSAYQCSRAWCDPASASLLEALLKAQYLIKQKALDRIRKAKRKWIILRLRDQLRPKVEPDSGCAVEVPSVSIGGHPTSADETKVSVSGIL